MQMTDQAALSAEVSKRVFGFWFDDSDTDRGPQWWGPHPSLPGHRAYASCCFDTNITGQSYRYSDGMVRFADDWPAAMLVVDKMNETFSTRHFFVEALRPLMPRADRPIDPSWWIFYLTPALICRAALAAVQAHEQASAEGVQDG
jgi:hypothetical protein